MPTAGSIVSLTIFSGRLCGDLLDVHAAFGAGHDQWPGRSAVEKHGEIKFFFDRGRAGHEQLADERPSGPVCLVTRTLPSIAFAFSKTSSADLHNFTPPWKPLLKVPLPRPPAWICDLTTTTFSPARTAFPRSLWPLPACRKLRRAGR